MTDPQPEPTERQKIILSLNKANNRLLSKFAKLGIAVDGISEERHELFFNFLVDIGFIPQEYMEEFNLKWVDHLNSKLVLMEKRVDEQLAEARKPKLIVPPGTVVPRDGRRPGSTGG